MAPRLLMLGSPAACVGTDPETLPLDLPGSLLFYLACRGTWVSRSELAFLYRADVPEAEALRYLRKLVYRARRLRWASGLEVTPERLRWRVETDVQGFEKALKEEDWRGAALYRGPFLAGLELPAAPAYAAWLDLERSEMFRRWASATRRCAGEFASEGRFAEALAGLNELAKHDPLDETTLQAQLHCLARSGGHGEAVRLFETFRERLQVELEVEPLESTLALIDSIRQSVNPGLTSRPSLPADTTRFVGREYELRELEGRFAQPDCRLVTLVGLGGTGKTRLALTFVRGKVQAKTDRYRDGVFFVSVAGAATPDSAMANIAEGLGVTLVGAKDPADQLLEFFRRRELFLVLDNFEQLKAHATFLETFLAGAPNLTLLVTSREALELRSESVLDVRGLSFPSSEEAAETFDAVELFLNRAERISNHFVRSAETVRAAAEIARRVEGLPLALELTASWTRHLSCLEILGALETSILLSTSLKHVPERHRSIAHVFETSLSQLSSPEGDALLRLSFFDGGFDLAAAGEVAGATLPPLLSLMNRSLVGRRGEDRYALHELLRQHLSGKLSPEMQQEVAEAHSRYYLGKLAEHETALVGLNPRRAQDALLADVDNIRQAYRESVRLGQWGQLERAFMSLRRLLFSSGLFKVAEGLYTHLLGLLEHAAEPEARRLRIQVALGRARARTHLFKVTTSESEALHSELKTLPDPEVQAELRYLLGREACHRGDYAKGAEHFEGGLNVCGGRDSAVATDLLEGAAMAAWFEGDYPGAVTYLRDWLELAHRRRDAAAIVVASFTLANRLKYVGDPEGERAGLVRSALKYRKAVSPYLEASVVNDYALLFLDQGDAATAEPLFRESLALITRTSDRHDSAVIAFNLARSLRAQNKYGEAHAMFERSREFFVLGCLQFAGLAETERLQGRHARAKGYLLEALISYREQPQALTQLLDVFDCLARLYVDEGKTRVAFELAAFIYHAEVSGEHQRSAIEPLYLDLKRDLRRGQTPDAKPLDSYLTEHISALSAAVSG